MPSREGHSSVRAGDAYEKGKEALQATWDEARTADTAPALPAEIVAAISSCMGSDAQVAQSFGLPTQVLLKIVVRDPDGRRIQKFESIEGQFSSRSFAKQTIVANKAVGRRIGSSGDPYVSNPLRGEDRLPDKLLRGDGAHIWDALFRVLKFVDTSPELAPAVLQQILRVIKDRPESTPQPTKSKEAKKPVDLSTLTEIGGVDQDLLLDIIEVLESDQPQVILAGPPGTSKTHVAVALAAYMTGGDANRFRVIQLHASYGYEEFVEGLRPTVRNEKLHFEPTPGAVRRITENWRADQKRVLILDEMNRANLPRVLGELLYALERRGEPVDLMYTPGFALPAGLAFIGTMNTADRSIRSIDAAVRRRFQIFDFPPSSDALRLFYTDVSNEVPDLIDGFEDLNTRLTQLLDRHHTVGHTFFMDNRGMTASRLRQTWLRQIAPLLEEYLFDQPDLLEGFTIEGFWPSVAGA